jgi:hypothetical protein
MSEQPERTGIMVNAWVQWKEEKHEKGMIFK